MDIIQRKNEENLKNSLADKMRNTISFETKTDIQNFYTGQNLFITGATGFMGKMLIEKLLRSCPDIENIYILCRPKKGKDVHTRVEEIFDDPVFNQLRSEVPKFRHKIVPMAGDCSMAGLGLSLTDRQKLISNVTTVFHAAATVRFDEKLKLAVSINVHGIRDVLNLCHQMTRLKAIIHVSTAYANCHLRRIEEKFYEFPIQLDELDRDLDKLNEKAIDLLTPKLIGEWPNTYTYTKALAEDMVRRSCKSLPVGIFRPAIVTSSAKEPLIGWIDNLYGPTGVVAGAGTGVLRTMHCDREINANIVPVDFCVNALIASAWDVYNHYKTLQLTTTTVPSSALPQMTSLLGNDDNNNHISTKELNDPSQFMEMNYVDSNGHDCERALGSHIPIYNYVSSVENPLTWGQFTELNTKLGFDYPFSSAIWYHCFFLHKTAIMNYIFMIFLHYLPAILIDGFSICIGQKPRLLKVYKKIHKMASIVSFFCNHEWVFTNDNTQRLFKKLTKTDQAIFNFNMKDMDWASYCHYYIRGMRIYLFKDDLSTLESARKKWNRFYYIHQSLKMFFAGLIFYGFWSMFSSYVC